MAHNRLKQYEDQLGPNAIGEDNDLGYLIYNEGGHPGSDELWAEASSEVGLSALQSDKWRNRRTRPRCTTNMPKTCSPCKNRDSPFFKDLRLISAVGVGEKDGIEKILEYGLV